MKYRTVQSTYTAINNRLDAKFYLSPAIASEELFVNARQQGLTFITLGESQLTRIWKPIRSKKMLATDTEESLPYLKPYDVFEYLPKEVDYISSNRMKNVDEYRLSSGLILQTCSGRNLGPLTMVDKYLEKFVIGSDMIRIDISDETLRYYILAYFKTFIGQNCLRQGKTGSVIDHISEQHIAEQQIPMLSDKIINSVVILMRKAFQLREAARLTLNNLQQQYQTHLPAITRLLSMKLGWSISSITLSNRLDAAFYDPLVASIRAELKNMGGVSIKEVANVYRPKGYFKRYYVNSPYGNPMVSGSQLLQENPINLQYISDRSFKDPDEYLLHTNWVAYQADGRVEQALGTPALITSDRDGWYASDHVGRLIPFENTNVGWLYLALSTPHAQMQLKSMASGSVVDTTFPRDMENVILPPILDVDGNEVILAWEKFAEAKFAESEAIKLIEDALNFYAIQ
ncbi:MAG: hypothetical protein SFZ02_00395 [bacterium]|nr:hypothetical protein [bacterium]